VLPGLPKNNFLPDLRAVGRPEIDAHCRSGKWISKNQPTPDRKPKSEVDKTSGSPQRRPDRTWPKRPNNTPEEGGNGKINTAIF